VTTPDRSGIIFLAHRESGFSAPRPMRGVLLITYFSPLTTWLPHLVK
jgi:hypothetical protein